MRILCVVFCTISWIMAGLFAYWHNPEWTTIAVGSAIMWKINESKP